MSRKGRGCSYERELVHMLHEMGFSSVRVAGSGCMKYPSPDIIASNKSRIIAFEVKSCQSCSVYLDVSDIEELTEFSNGFGCRALVCGSLVWKGLVF